MLQSGCDFLHLQQNLIAFIESAFGVKHLLVN